MAAAEDDDSLRDQPRPLDGKRVAAMAARAAVGSVMVMGGAWGARLPPTFRPAADSFPDLP